MSPADLLRALSGVIGRRAALAALATWAIWQVVRRLQRSVPRPRLSKQDPLQLFAKQFLFLRKIILPRLWSREGYFLGLHSVALVCRTFLSIYVSQLDGMIVKNIVERNTRTFAYFMLRWILVAVPATFVNSVIRYMENKLTLAFRTRLAQHAYSKYMGKQTYYRVGNLDLRLTNADQNLTEDVLQFCSGTAHLYSQLSKPLLDVVLICWTLVRQNQSRGSGFLPSVSPLVLASGVIGVTGVLLRLCSPAFGQLAAEQANRDGHLRYVHSRIIANAEEIAFYGGHRIEESILRKAYNALVSHANAIYLKKLSFVMLEQFLMKYVWSGAGMIMIALPTLLDDHRDDDSPSSNDTSISERTKVYTVSHNLLVSAADAIERIMSSYKTVVELSGYTGRVYNMLAVFDDVHNGVYKKADASTLPIDLAPGVVHEGADEIELVDVPIVTPNNDLLVQSLSVKIPPGRHLLITGPNGCGKSSLFRILGGLWPIYRGTLFKPAAKDLFYIPQRPYLSLGNLRDQIIYPDTIQDFWAKGLNDNDLLKIMKHASLIHIVDRDGWDEIKDWKDVLSGGEKQRVGLARLFYHRPAFALLDECTSAISIDVEDALYQHAKDIGTTLLTITHRPSLWKHHTHLLQFDGCGECKLTELDVHTRLSYRDEKEQLREKIAQFPALKKRFQHLCQILGEDAEELQD